MLAFLSGSPTFQVLIDEADVKRIFDGVEKALAMQGRYLVERLGAVAVEYLQSGYEGLGREYLARHWRKGPSRVSGDTVSVLVYNDLEDKDIPNTDARGKRPSGYRHRIKGANLLTILEYGANPHDISPTFIPAKGPAMLRFLAPLGGVKSMFAGTVHAPGKGLEAYLYKDDSQDSIFAEGVHHPGVTGDHLIQDAQRMIEARLAVEVSTVLRGVAATLV